MGWRKRLGAAPSVTMITTAGLTRSTISATEVRARLGRGVAVGVGVALGPAVGGRLVAGTGPGVLGAGTQAPRTKSPINSTPATQRILSPSRFLSHSNSPPPPPQQP